MSDLIKIFAENHQVAWMLLAVMLVVILTYEGRERNKVQKELADAQIEVARALATLAAKIDDLHTHIRLQPSRRRDG